MLEDTHMYIFCRVFCAQGITEEQQGNKFLDPLNYISYMCKFFIFVNFSLIIADDILSVRIAKILSFSEIVTLDICVNICF